MRPEHRHGGQQNIRDALLTIVRSAASSMPHGSTARRPCTPAKSDPLSEHDAGFSGSVTPAAWRKSSRQSGDSPAVSRWTPRCSGIAAVSLESPVRRRKTALAELQSAKLELARALEQLRDCASGSEAQPPLNVGREPASDSRQAAL